MSILTHTVKFNKPVTFTDHTGVKFTNTTTAETATGVTTTVESSPSDTLTYTDVTWLVDPVPGDVIVWDYDGLGNYADASQGETTLNFAGDTLIEVAGITLQVNQPGRLECTFRCDETTIDRHIFDVNAGNQTYLRCRAANSFRSQIGGTGANGGAYLDATEYDLVWSWDGTGNSDVLLGGVSQGGFIVGTALNAQLLIGANGTLSAGMLGLIKDVRLYDSGGTLTNHWPINDNSNTIVDIVGGVNGVLTIGTGSWVTAGEPMEAGTLTLVNCLDGFLVEWVNNESLQWAGTDNMEWTA